jgi:hypothetical protein
MASESSRATGGGVNQLILEFTVVGLLLVWGVFMFTGIQLAVLLSFSTWREFVGEIGELGFLLVAPIMFISLAVVIPLLLVFRSVHNAILSSVRAHRVWWLRICALVVPFVLSVFLVRTMAANLAITDRALLAYEAVLVLLFITVDRIKGRYSNNITAHSV